MAEQMPVLYPTTEHYFQAAKSLELREHEWIRRAPNPKTAKARGRKVLLRSDWEAVRFEIMLTSLRAKFNKEPFRNQLLQTSGSYLAEDSPYDPTWGIRAKDGTWTGTNLLGRALMIVRDEIS